jgi:hypothetical protein
LFDPVVELLLDAGVNLGFDGRGVVVGHGVSFCTVLGIVETIAQG